MKFLVVLAVTLAVASAARVPKYSDDKINIHIVPHTHDDVGWLKTVDQYYMGANNSIQHAGVQYILDSTIQALAANPDRKFIYVEQAFFQRWWRQQTPDIQNLTKKLVADGQLAFVNGGWCMHDEAATHYIAMIDQTTLGHTFLKSEFDYKPRIGWQIDPFGHSSTHASLLSAAAGFDALFFGRIDYQDRALRLKEQRMEFVWRASQSLGAPNQIFTGAFQSGNYGPPSGFCFDQFCSDPPMQADPALEDYNVPERVEGFVKAVQSYYAQNADTKHIMFKMGSDFQYENANEWFKNLDVLIREVNKNGTYNAFYSTPELYVDAVHNANMSWTVKTDDFFPYADNFDAYWTGYFTSRPALKGYVRSTSSYLQAARQLEVYGLPTGTDTVLGGLEEAVGVAQHHDAVSGTAKQHTTFDYAKRLAKGMATAMAQTNTIMGAAVTSGHAGSTAPDFSQCRKLNESICTVTQSATSFAVVLYNPMTRSRGHRMRIPIEHANATVTDAKGSAVNATVLKNTLPPSEGSSANSLFFTAHLPPMGYTTYFVTVSDASPASAPAFDEDVVANSRRLRSQDPEDTVVTNGAVQLTYGADGRLKTFANTKSGVSIAAKQDFLWYNSTASGPGWGAPSNAGQASGAYIFRPNTSTPFPVNSGNVELSVVHDSVVTVVTQTWAPWLVQETLLWHGAPHLETNFLIGPIPFEDGLGKEVISRWTTDIGSGYFLFTDSNGREMQRRKLNYRPTWHLNVTEPVAGNYYPVNSIAFINDTESQLTVLTDRSQGGASLAQGEMEIMLHRRILHDDGRGVGEPLNETVGITPYPNPKRIGHGLIIRGGHRILLEKTADSASAYRDAADATFFDPVAFFSDMSGSTPSKWASSYSTSATWISGSLPNNVALITARVWGKSSYLLRLAHQFAVGEDPVMSQPVTVDLATLLPSHTITDVAEMSLTANQPASDVHRLQWTTDDAASLPAAAPSPAVAGTNVTLSAQEVKTYVVTVAA